MPRLARSASHAQPTYDAVVVGSGYGGGVAASRLARIGLKVAVLERGREFLPGEFPDTLLGANGELQISGRGRRIGSADALFDLRMGADVHALVGCGLGGTSLINANVCLTPDLLVLEDEAWPEDIRADHRLNIGFHRARGMLQPERLPETSTPLKFAALEKAAKAFGHEAERVPLHVAFSERVNAAGVLQPACTQCGDCMGGCNVGAKTTVHGTYLADAVNHGASLFTGANVRLVERVGGDLWRVVFQRLDAKERAVPVGAITTAMVVLAAGTLGSAEILLRSRERGLRLSDRLGQRFSSNADVIAFGYNNDAAVNAIGVGHPARAKVPPPGPGVSGLIDLRRRRDPLDRIAIVEASVQSAMAKLMGMMVPAAPLLGNDTDKGLQDLLAEARRSVESLVAGAYTGAIHNTQVLLAVGHDAAAGQLVLENDAVRIHWPGAIQEPVYAHIAAALRKAVSATGGTFVPNPVGNRFLGGNLFTVHPLGGCAMGRDRASGVVDHKCRVFDGDPKATGNAVHEGLYVCDGSVIPRPLGVHPLLTITAVAERAMLLFARDHGLPLDVAARADAPRRDLRVTRAESLKPGFGARIAARIGRRASAS